MATTVPGGRYIGTDGKWHDANGNILTMPAASDTQAVKPMPAAQTTPTMPTKPAGTGKK